LLAGLGQVVVLKTGFLASLAVPIDGGLRWRGKPVLGPRKTWRGVVVMSMLSALVAGGQAFAARRSARLRALSPFDYGRTNPWLLGFVLGVGYCAAEFPNSFVKRRLDIPPAGTSDRWGRLQYLVDQSDSVTGCPRRGRAQRRRRARKEFEGHLWQSSSRDRCQPSRRRRSGFRRGSCGSR